MIKQTYAEKVFIQTEVLIAVVHQRFIRQGYDFKDASTLAQGYMQSFLVTLLTERRSHKDTLARIADRISDQQKQISKLCN